MEGSGPVCLDQRPSGFSSHYCTCTHTRTSSHMHTCTHPCMHPPTPSHTCTPSCTHAHAHAHVHTLTHTHAHAHTHAHTRHAPCLDKMCSWPFCSATCSSYHFDSCCPAVHTRMCPDTVSSAVGCPTVLHTPCPVLRCAAPMPSTCGPLLDDRHLHAPQRHPHSPRPGLRPLSCIHTGLAAVTLWCRPPGGLEQLRAGSDVRIIAGV